MDLFKDKLLNKHCGENALVCGEGPSLDYFPRSFYRDWNGFSVGINRIKLLFMPDYWIALDLMGHNIEDCNRYAWYTYPLKYEANDIGKKDGFFESGLGSISHAISAAYHMGASNIYLIGIDFCYNNGKRYYKERGVDLCQEEIDQNSWYEDYLFRKKEKLRPQLESYKRNGVNIFNLSPISKIDYIEKIKLGD